MRISTSGAVLLILTALPLSSCCSPAKHSSVGSVAAKEYRACCGKECDASCKLACCKEYFANDNAKTYCASCGKECDSSCKMACCQK
jgi:hypothetical protein